MGEVRKLFLHQRTHVIRSAWAMTITCKGRAASSTPATGDAVVVGLQRTGPDMFPAIVHRMVNPVIAVVLRFAGVRKDRIDESGRSLQRTET
jgi:hypothetical protein